MRMHVVQTLEDGVSTCHQCTTEAREQRHECWPAKLSSEWSGYWAAPCIKHAHTGTTTARKTHRHPVEVTQRCANPICGRRLHIVTGPPALSLSKSASPSAPGQMEPNVWGLLGSTTPGMRNKQGSSAKGQVGRACSWPVPPHLLQGSQGRMSGPDIRQTQAGVQSGKAAPSARAAALKAQVCGHKHVCRPWQRLV